MSNPPPVRSEYRRNHYVPDWFQRRFLLEDSAEAKFYYLDLHPETRIQNGHRYTRNGVLRWGPPRCFVIEDLYTTKFADLESTEIEEKFFGKIDSMGKNAVEYFANFAHPSADGDSFNALLRYMSAQKLRTPKGLAHFAHMIRERETNQVLFRMQQFHTMHCALWTECVWSLLDASDSPIKFLLSDHPVTVYNQACFPESKWCRDNFDPPIWFSGTHTLFPFDLNRMLVLTNLSWARDPYGNPLKERPNPSMFRPAMFNFQTIQTGRSLTETEVDTFNFIIKKRAHRYIAAAEKDWLFPETRLKRQQWDKLSDRYLLMPDPRAMNFSSEIVIGFKGGGADRFDAYGRKPEQSDFGDKVRSDREWNSFHAFKCEYARRFGPKKRGISFQFGSLDPHDYSPDYHKALLRDESLYKALMKKKR